MSTTAVSESSCVRKSFSSVSLSRCHLCLCLASFMKSVWSIIYMTVQACGCGDVVFIRFIILLFFILFGLHGVLVMMLLLISRET